ncbi:MAG: transposase family protein [Planctomycetaceae bacterium]|nr:transposase family protein [Planctomycetaceae bacterium]
MFAVLKTTQEKRQKKGGKLSKLSIGDQLFLTIQYWREHRTMTHIAYDFGITKNTVRNTIMQVENTLLQNGTFQLPHKKTLLSQKNTAQISVANKTKNPIKHPKTIKPPKKSKKNGIPVKRNNTQ